MNTYLQELIPVLDWLLQSPDSSFERWLTLVLAVIAGSLVLLLAARAFRVDKHGFWTCAVVVLINWLLTLAALVVVRVHLPQAQPWVEPAVAGAVLLVFGLLGMRVLMRAKWGSALLPWCIGVAAMAGVILLTHAVFESAATGGRQAGTMQQHKRQLREITGD